MTTHATSDSPVYHASADPTSTTDVLPRSPLNEWWVAFAASSVFVVSGHLLIKAGLNGLTTLPATTEFFTRILQIALNPTIIAGLLIYVMGTVCWMRAVSQKEISFLYPLSSINFVLILVASTILLQETITFRRIAGVTLVVIGMIVMNTGSKERRA